MIGKDGEAGGAARVRALLCVLVTTAPGAAWALPNDFAPTSYVGGVDPNLVWDLLIGGIVVCSFLVAIALWIHSALRSAKRSHLRRNASISSALDHLDQGLVMTDAKRRVIFCNDRYLQIYGLNSFGSSPWHHRSGSVGPAR